MSHPILHAMGGILTRRNLRKDGKSREEVREAMEGYTRALVEQAVETAETSTGLKVPEFAKPTGTVGEFGDGYIIKAIEDFFQTPLGQLILSIIKMLLMGLIAV